MLVVVLMKGNKSDSYWSLIIYMQAFQFFNTLIFFNADNVLT